MSHFDSAVRLPPVYLGQYCIYCIASHCVWCDCIVCCVVLCCVLYVASPRFILYVCSHSLDGVTCACSFMSMVEYTGQYVEYVWRQCAFLFCSQFLIKCSPLWAIDVAFLAFMHAVRGCVMGGVSTKVCVKSTSAAASVERRRRERLA